jgi:hypothetical protein
MIRGRGRSEATIVWNHPRTLLKLKCRIDKLIPKLAILEIKTTRSIQPGRFATSCAQLAYQIQFALYADAVAAAGYGSLPFYVVAVENEPPYEVVLYEAKEEDILSFGRLQYEDALDIVAACQNYGKWPGFASEETLNLKLPDWAKPSLETTTLITPNGKELTL